MEAKAVRVTVMVDSLAKEKSEGEEKTRLAKRMGLEKLHTSTKLCPGVRFLGQKGSGKFKKKFPKTHSRITLDFVYGSRREGKTDYLNPHDNPLPN